jgi:hypothetical protein
MAPAIDPLVNRISSPDAILKGFPFTDLLSLLVLALVIGVLAKSLTKAVSGFIDSRSIINLKQ